MKLFERQPSVGDVKKERPPNFAEMFRDERKRKDFIIKIERIKRMIDRGDKEALSIIKKTGISDFEKVLGSFVRILSEPNDIKRGLGLVKEGPNITMLLRHKDAILNLVSDVVAEGEDSLKRKKEISA